MKSTIAGRNIQRPFKKSENKRCNLLAFYWKQPNERIVFSYTTFRLVFFNKEKMRKIWMIFDLEN